MKVIYEYTLDHIRRNKRTSAAIMMAILLSATLLNCLCTFLYSFRSWQIDMEKYRSGSWHGELYENISGDRLEAINSYAHVEQTMVKGKWEIVQLPDAALPYLLLREADAGYWAEMSEKNTLLEGRLPAASGEIAVSKLFFDRNPQYRLGDQLTLPVGERVLEKEVLNPQTIAMAGETFKQNDRRAFTIVGKLDLTSSTVYPGYYALGWLERSQIQPDDQITVYLKFNDIKNTYRYLPEVSKLAGHEPNQFGEYPVRYHDALLQLKGVRDPNMSLQLADLVVIVIGVVLLGLVLGTFVLIIQSIFSLSSESRRRQMGMLRSIGATPKQIRHSVIFEGLMLAWLPILLSILLGFLFTIILTDRYNQIARELMEFPIEVVTNGYVITAGILLSVITVLGSSYITAGKSLKLSPHQAVQGFEGKAAKKRREKKHVISAKLFGFSGVLAADTLAAHKKRYRSPVAALCISFILFASILCLVVIANKNINLGQNEEYYDVTAMLFLSEDRDEELIQRIRKLPSLAESGVVSSVNCATYVESSMESAAFREIGGFAAADSMRYHIVKVNEQYELNSTLVGIDEQSFARYCRQIGADPEIFLQEGRPKAIVVNSIFKNPDARKRSKQAEQIEFLDLQIGDPLTIYESFDELVKSDYAVDVEIGAVAAVLPELDWDLGNYRIYYVVPLSVYDSLTENFMPERAHIYKRTDIKGVTADGDSLTAEKEINEICSQYLGSEDYQVVSKMSEAAKVRTANQALQSITTGISLLIAVIGIANALSTAAGNLRIRRREFAMLRSVGLDDRGLNRLLFLEGLFFALKPVLISVPVVLMICHLFLWMIDFSWLSFLAIFPWRPLSAYLVVLVLALGAAYYFGSGVIRRDNIVDGLKDERV